MNITTIETRTFEKMTDRVSAFVSRVESLYQLHRKRNLGDWLDNQDVCLLLSISPRTLQTLRDNGTLSYSQISRKIYYKREDVTAILSVVEQRKKDLYFRNHKT
ncbi:MAG: helix-turn-helix domain-containing protein [Bacteroides sp.]|nr:helix-turn-helix domain-containing protein [Bacteroides sp.]